MSHPGPDDPAVKAARIGRNGGVVAAVIASLITGTATGLSAYFAGREQGESATPPPVTVTVVREAPAGGPATTSTKTAKSLPAGQVPLLEVEPFQADSRQAIEDLKVNTEERNQAITARLGDCDVYPLSENYASRTYQLDRKYRRLQVEVGLSDDSPNGSTVQFRVFVDNELVQPSVVKVGVGTTEKIDVDISGAFRIVLDAQRIYDAGAGCLNEPFVHAAWFNGVLS